MERPSFPLSASEGFYAVLWPVQYTPNPFSGLEDEREWSEAIMLRRFVLGRSLLPFDRLKLLSCNFQPLYSTLNTFAVR